MVKSVACKYLTFCEHEKAKGDPEKELWFDGVKFFAYRGDINNYIGYTLYDRDSGMMYWVCDSDGVNVTDNLACST